MNICFLLAFSLMTGSVVATRPSGCQGGWVKFNCKNLDNETLPKNKTKITQNETKDYQYTVVVTNLQPNDTIRCIDRAKPLTNIRNCTKPHINHSAFNKAQTTIVCGFPQNRSQGPETFLCKSTSDYDCEDVQTINAHVEYSKNKGDFNITFPEVTPEDKGVYWCVAKGHELNVTYRKVSLNVHSDFTDEKKHLVPGEDFQHEFINENLHLVKMFFCKGKDPLTCQHLANTSGPNPSRFALSNDKVNTKIHLTIKNITEEDAGVYWFGAMGKKQNKIKIFYRLELTRNSSIAQNNIFQVALSVTLVVVVVGVIIAVPVLYKRRRDTPKQNRKEENVYDKIQDSAAGGRITTVYATAEDCQESVQYASLDFDKSSKSNVYSDLKLQQ